MADIFKLSNEADMDRVEANLSHTDEQHNKYKFVKCVERNVLLIGRTRTGKSTIARVLQDCLNTTTASSLYSETKEVSVTKVITGTENQKLFCNIIDTPGLFDIKKAGSQAMTNLQIKCLIDNCLSTDITNINLVLFTFSLANGINQNDLDSMKFIKQHYPEIGKHAALVITHSEHLTSADKEKLLNEFWIHPTACNENFKEFFGKGVIYMGCMRLDAFENKDAVAVYIQYKNVLQMRTDFIELCLSCEDCYNMYNRAEQCKIL